MMTNEVIDGIKLWFQEDFTEFDSKDGLNKDNPFELKRFNIIVGANNAGKSRFIREVGLKILEDKLCFKHIETYKQALDDLKILFKGIFPKEIPQISEHYIYNSQTIKEHLNKTRIMLQHYINALEGKNTSSRVLQDIPHLNSINIENDKSKIKESCKTIEDVIFIIDSIKQRNDVKALYNKKVYYIGILRSLKKISFLTEKNKTDSYKNDNPLLNQVLHDYYFTEDQIISGEDFFEFLTDSLLGMPDERQNVRDYQEKLSHYFIISLTTKKLPLFQTEKLMHYK